MTFDLQDYETGQFAKDQILPVDRLFIIVPMATREANKTKEALHANQQKFKELQGRAEEARDELTRKLYQEMSVLEEEQQNRARKNLERKKRMKLKSELQPYAKQDNRDVEDIPVDGEVKAGSMVFMKNCSTCHSLEAVDVRPMKGPPLGLIYNRKVGSNTNYELYSNELMNSSFYWTPRNLYMFMGNPASLLPFTKCKLWKSPLQNEADRADLINLFRQFTSELSFNVRLKQIQSKGYNNFQTNLHAAKEQRNRGRQREESEAKRERKII